LGVTQIPNLAYATTIATASQVTIAHHGNMLNNPNPVLILINLSPQQLIVVITNIPHAIDALAFTDLVREFFRILELEFSIKSFEKNLEPPLSIGKRMKPSRCFT